MTPLSCATVGYIQWINAGLAFAAAIFWLWASLVTVPDSLDDFTPALRTQSRMNAIGALFAASAAAVSGYLILLPSCLNLQ